MTATADSSSHQHPRVLLGIIIVGCIIAVTFSIAGFILYERQQDTIQAAHRAEYRICQRQMVNRAAIDLPLGNDEPHLALYDCTPNLKGQPARRLSDSEAQAFEQHVRTTPASQLP